jgi:hypothetical protein
VGECWAGGEGDCEAYGDHGSEVTRAVGAGGRCTTSGSSAVGLHGSSRMCWMAWCCAWRKRTGFFDEGEIRGTAAEDGAGCGIEYYVDGWDLEVLDKKEPRRETCDGKRDAH